MKLIKYISITILLNLFLSIGCLAQEPQPTVPYIQKNMCPFECCQYGNWTVRTPVTVYKKEGSTSDVVFTIKPGEQITAISGNVHISELGVLVVKKSFNVFKKDTKAYLLSYRGEGAHDLWYQGKIFNGGINDEFWLNVVIEKYPKMTWWVLIKNNKGKQGWLMLKNIDKSGFQIKEKIDGDDSCS